MKYVYFKYFLIENKYHCVSIQLFQYLLYEHKSL